MISYVTHFISFRSNPEKAEKSTPAYTERLLSAKWIISIPVSLADYVWDRIFRTFRHRVELIDVNPDFHNIQIYENIDTYYMKK